MSSSVATILFTDIEGSTRLWEQEGDRMSAALARHDLLARAAVAENHGVVVKMIGDGMYAAFDDPLDGLNATLMLQRSVADPAATNGIALRVRCGLHLGVVERRDNDYFGNPVNRTARIMSVAHGGQVLLSQAVVDDVGTRMPTAATLRDLGSVRLKDLATPEHVYQVLHPELRQDFPALRSLEATPNNLPQQLTSFIGRERELAEATELLKGTRLLTLLGMGGLGKTRLSLQTAADELLSYPDGVWFVELAPVSDPSLVPQTVSEALGIREISGEALTQTLADLVKNLGVASYEADYIRTEAQSRLSPARQPVPESYASRLTALQRAHAERLAALAQLPGLDDEARQQLKEAEENRFREALLGLGEDTTSRS